jgi:hypothetical protein
MGVTVQRQFQHAADGGRILRQLYYARYVDWGKCRVLDYSYPFELEADSAPFFHDRSIHYSSPSFGYVVRAISVCTVSEADHNATI